MGVPSLASLNHCFLWALKEKVMKGTNLNKSCDSYLKYRKTVLLTSRCGCSVIILDTHCTSLRLSETRPPAHCQRPWELEWPRCYLLTRWASYLACFVLFFSHSSLYLGTAEKTCTSRFVKSQFDPHRPVVLRWYESDTSALLLQWRPLAPVYGKHCSPLWERNNLTA